MILTQLVVIVIAQQIFATVVQYLYFKTNILSILFIIENGFHVFRLCGINYFKDI